ncbi:MULTISPECIES: hypothetical protein [unclassified Streptomyces]|uniref:hypothetical protein n=1 Tax=unclassified Streptomyces TaxID=2593676 RepID=UPI0036EC7A4C
MGGLQSRAQGLPLSLGDFAQLTSDEFDSCTQFRYFMRSRLLAFDDALEASTPKSPWDGSRSPSATN